MCKKSVKVLNTRFKENSESLKYVLKDLSNVTDESDLKVSILELMMIEDKANTHLKRLESRIKHIQISAFNKEFGTNTSTCEKYLPDGINIELKDWYNAPIEKINEKLESVTSDDDNHLKIWEKTSEVDLKWHLVRQQAHIFTLNSLILYAEKELANICQAIVLKQFSTQHAPMKELKCPIVRDSIPHPEASTAKV